MKEQIEGIQQLLWWRRRCLRKVRQNICPLKPGSRISLIDLVLLESHFTATNICPYSPIGFQALVGHISHVGWRRNSFHNVVLSPRMQGLTIAQFQVEQTEEAAPFVPSSTSFGSESSMCLKESSEKRTVSEVRMSLKENSSAWSTVACFSLLSGHGPLVILTVSPTSIPFSPRLYGVVA